MGTARSWIRFAGVALALGGAAALFLLVESIGANMSPPDAGGTAPASVVSVSTVVHAAGPADTMSHLLVALAAIVAATRALGWVAERAGQPSVVGEIVAGIALGPSLLGALWPAATTTLFPSSITPFLAAVSELGVILFMFMVGLEFDTAHLRRQARTAIAVSTAGIVLPFVLGVLLALWLYPRFGIGSSGFVVFSLFVGTAMSITAFPVLARILKALSLSATPLGVTALTSAAELAARYINDRHLPDKAIDVIDEAGAAQRILPKSKQRKIISKTEIEDIKAVLPITTQTHVWDMTEMVAS